MSTPSPGLRARSLLADDELEPYVRKKRTDREPKKKMLGLNEEEQNVLRTSINSRERKRMHDLNEALEELRSCLPYSQDVHARKMSKINTLLLACNWIRQLNQANQALQIEVSKLRAIVKEDKSTTTSFGSNVPVTFTAGITAIQTCAKTFGQPCFCIACITSVARHQ